MPIPLSPGSVAMTCFVPRSLLSSFLSTLLVLHGLLAPVRAEAPALFGLDDIPLASARLTPPDPSSKLLGLGEIDLSRSRRWAALQDQVRPRAAELPELAGLEQPALDPHLERYIAQPLRQTGEHLSGLFSNEQQVAGVLEQIKQGGVDIEQKLVQAGEEKLQAMVDSGLDNVTQRLQGSILPQLDLSYRAPFSGREELFHINAMLLLWETSNHLLFNQGGLLLRDGEDGANLGLGYRFLAGEGLLLGVNTFYDWLSDPDVERWSVGAEARSAWLDLHGNWYQGRGNDRDGDTLYYSPDGWDIELAAHLPTVPWVELGASYYLWEGEGGQDDLEGYRYQLSLKPFTLWNIGLEYDDPDGNSGSWGVKADLNYQFGVPLSNQLAFRGTQGTPDLWSRRYEKIEREYAIRVRERRTAPAVPISTPGFAELRTGALVEVPLPPSSPPLLYENTATASDFRVTPPGDISLTNFNDTPPTLVLTYTGTTPSDTFSITITAPASTHTGSSDLLVYRAEVSVNPDPTAIGPRIGTSRLPDQEPGQAQGCNSGGFGAACVDPGSGATTTVMVQAPITPSPAGSCPTCQISLAFDFRFAGTATLGADADYTVTTLTLALTPGGSAINPNPITFPRAGTTNEFTVTLTSVTTHYLNATLFLIGDADVDAESIELENIENPPGNGQTLLTLEPMDTPYAELEEVTSPLTETNLNGATVTVTLTNAVYLPGLAAGDFRPLDTVQGTVSITGVSPDSAMPNRGATLTLGHSGGDINADGTLVVTVLDSAHSGSGNLNAGSVPLAAVAGVSVTPVAVTVGENGGTNTYTLVLDKQPTADVTLTAASGDTTVATVSVASLSFTPANWDTPQTVTVTGIDDAIDNASDRTATVTHTATSSDSDYNTVPVAAVTVTAADNDGVGVNVLPAAVTVNEDGGTNTYTLALASEPIAEVTITPTSGNTAIATVSPPTLSFTPSDWNVAQTVTVTGIDDVIDNPSDRTVPITHTLGSADSGYNGLPVAAVTVTATDDDDPGVSVSETALTVDENSDTGAYTVELDSQPTANVNLTLSSSALSVATVSPPTLSFTPSDWNVPQTVTVTGIDDDLDNPVNRTATISHALSSSDASYSVLGVASVVVTATDDDVAGVSIDPTMLTVDENSGAGAYTVVLDSQPTANVGFTLASGDTTIAMVSPPTLSFTPSAWNVAQTVTVTGVNDDIVNPGDRTTAITHTIASADGDYDTLVESVDVIADDDDAGVRVTPTTLSVPEARGTGTYTLVLESEPTAGVTIMLASGDTNIATVSLATLSFTTANWNVAQTVTVTGVNDDIDNDPVRIAPIRHTTASSDDDYDAADVDDVVVSATDDDVAGVQVTPSALSVDESTGTGTYTLALESEPTGTVTITPTSGAVSVAMVSGALSFTPSNWNVAQTVTVTGVDDAIDNNPVRTATISHTISGGGYNAVPVTAVTVTADDDDVAGVSVDPTMLTVDENSGAGTYTVVLDSQPTANVSFTLASGDTTIAMVSPPTLSFTPSVWNVAQTVTVTGVNDDIVNPGDRTTAITHTINSADGDYDTLNVASVDVIADDDDAGVRVTPTTLSVPEADGTGTYTLVLESEPTAGVTIMLASGDTNIATVSLATLSFTTSNWNVAQTVTVTGVNDDIDNDPVRIAPISHTTASSDDDYDAADVDDVVVSATDDDVAGVQVTPPALSVDESTGTGAYTLALESEPTGTVTITPTSGAVSVAMVSGALSFTPSNWNVAQTVTVTGVDDAIDNNPVRTATISHTISGGGYNAVPVTDVTVTADDDDTAGVSVDPTMLTVDENSGAGAYTVVLDSQPTANVSFTLASGDTMIAMVSPPTLSFTPSNWNVAQTVTVTGVNDEIINNPDRTTAITHTIDSADVGYDTLSVDSVDVIADDDDAGVSVSRTALTVAENSGTGSYTLVLDSQPTDDATVTLTGVDTTIAMVSPPTLTFTPSAWNTAQTVTVTGVNDGIDNPVDRTVTISHTVASADRDYNGVDVDDVVVTSDDDDDPGVSVTPTTVTVAENRGTDTYTLVLDVVPTDSVTVTPASGDTNIATVSAALSFTTSNWNVAQTVTVTGVNDDVDNAGNRRTATITHALSSSGDPSYNSPTVTVTDVSVSATDDDTASVSVAPATVTVAEDNGTDTYTVVLESEPTGTVTITPASSADPVATVSGALSFTPSNWNVAQTVTVTGVNDNRVNASARTATISHTISGGGYNSVPVADVGVSATDDDVAGVSVSETALTVDEGGGTGTYTLALESEPIGTVTITPASSAVPVATVSGALSFTPANWNVAQTVTVTGVNDNRVNASPRTATISHTISGGDYNSVPVADVGVSVTDNDVARVSIMPTALTVDEDGGAGAYTVVLDSQPTDDVSLTLASGDTTIAMVSPPTLSFIPAAWNVAQTVTVTGVNDDIINPGDRTAAITHTIDSADGDYDTLSVDSVDVTADDDDAGVRVTPTTLSVPENGGTGTYTLVLESEPTDGVTITLASGDTNIATVSLATLSFTTANWNTAQTVTVTGINDDIDNDPVRTTPISHTSASSDDDYDTADVDDVVVTATDDDVAGVSVAPTMVTVAEGNGIGSYTVALGSQPAANVTITPASSAVPVATVSGALSFTPANWNVPQTVTVTGVNDDLDNASDRTATITHAIDSTDGDYSVLPVDDVSVTATDDDVAGVSVVPTVITVNEDSGTNVYTVVLGSRPTAAVTITPTSGDTDLATVSGALSFAPAAWNVAQTVTVTGVDDGIENAVPRMTAITHAIDSTDGDYGSLDVDDVSVSGVSLPQAGLFSIGDDNATEGSTIDTANFELRLSLDTLELDPGQTLPVQFQIDPAEAAADYRLFLGATELSADPGATNRYTVPVDATGVRAVQLRAGQDAGNTDDQVTVLVLPGTGYLVSSTAPSLVLTLRDDDRLVVPFQARWSVDESRSTTSIREGEGRAVFWLQFDRRVAAPRTVNLQIASATATRGADYNVPDSRVFIPSQPNLLVLRIPDGIHEFPLYFDIVDDNVRERTETVEFSLFGVNPRLDNLRVTIIDNELPLVEIRSPRSRLFEGQSVRLPLRVQPTEHPLLEVGYQVRGVDAADFRLAVPSDVDTQLNVNADGLSGTLTIPQNAGAGALRLEAVDDGMAGTDLPLEFVLQASPGNVTVGDSLSVTLVDVTSAQAQAGIVEPSDSLTIEEAGEAGEVVVELSVTPATRQVQFTFVSGTPAPELTDYSVVSVSASDGTLSGTGPDYTIAFPASNSVQRHRLSISANADTDSATEQLEFRLSDPAPDSGYSLAARRSVDITLLDADNSLPQVGLRITSPSRFRESAPLLRMVDRVTGFSTPLADSDGLRAVVILGADIQPGGDGVAVNFRITGVDTGLGNSAASEIRVDTNREGNDGNVVVPITENGTSAQNFFTITIPSTAQSGAFQQLFLIWATLDGITEGNETLVLEILPGDGYIPNSFETLVSSLSPNPLQYMPELSFVVEDASLSSAVLSAASATVTAVEGGAAVPVDLSLSATLLQVPVQLRIVEASGALAPESGDYQLRSAAGTQGTLESTADPLLYRVVFPPAGSSQTHRLLVSALSDSDADPERLTLRLESPAGSRYDVGTGQSVQIDVEDGSPLVSVQAPELTTLLEGAAPVNFALRLERPAAAPLPVRFSISGLQRADFTLTAVSGGTLAFENANVLSGTLTFAQDSAALQLQLRVPADLIVESQERFTFTLPEVTDNSYGLAPPPAVTEFAVDIEESLLPAVRFDLAASDLVATEGSTTDLAQLQIVLDPPATGSMPVNLPLEFRPPPAFGDYQVLQNNTPLNADTNAAPGAARYLLSGVNSGLVSVRVRAVADLDRTSERISVRLLPGAGFRFPPSGDLEAELSIQEAALMQLSLAFSEGSVEEGGTVMLSLRLSADAPRPLQVGYRISGVQVGDFELFGDRDGVPGTAEDDSVLLQDVLVLAADSATASYELRISDDRLLEGTETLRLELLPSVDGSYGLGANSAELRIDDNDPAQVGFVQARPVAGEAAGTVALQVRSQPAPLTDLQVGYRFNSDRSNVALGVDFMLSGLNADNAGTLTLTPQAPQADITLSLVDDLLNEGPFEEALFQLQPPPPGASYILGQQDTLLRIYDNEAPTSTPRVTFEQVESLAGEGGPARVQLRVEPPSGDELTVSYGAMPAGTAASGADYAALSGSLTVPPNAGGAELLIELIDDGQDEPEETLALMLANPVASAGYQLGDARTHLLRIQDAQIPALSFAPASQTLTEGSAALASSRMERTATISLAVEPSSQRPLRVRYRVSTRSSARLSKDYSGLPEPGGVSVWAVPANAATSSFSVQVLPDSEPEPDEQLIVELLPSDDGGYVLGEQAVYTLTIRSNGDDGSRPRALFGALGGTVVEGMAFEVPLQVQGFSGPLAVNVVAVGAATTAETDDYSFSGSLTLSSPGGEVLRVQTGQDSDNQDELLVLEFSASPAYDRAINTLEESRFVLHIDDNEPASGQVVQFEDGDSSVREPSRTSSGPSQHQVFLTRSATAGVLNVSLRAVNRGGAQSSGSPADYRLASNTVRFNAGQARVPVQLTLLRDRSVTFLGGRVGINNEDRQEGDQTVELALLPGSGYQLGAQRSHRVRIADLTFLNQSGFCRVADGRDCSGVPITEGDIFYFDTEPLTFGGGGQENVTAVPFDAPVSLYFCVYTSFSAAVSTLRGDNPEFLLLNVERLPGVRCDNITDGQLTQAYRVIIPAGRNSARVAIEIIDDDKVERGTGENAGHRLVAGFAPDPRYPYGITAGSYPASWRCNADSGDDVGNSAMDAICRITDNDQEPAALPRVGFAEVGATVDEADGTQSLTVNLDTPSPGGLVVRYQLGGSPSLELDRDYRIDALDRVTRVGRLVVPPGDSSATLDFSLLDNPVPLQGERVLTLALQPQEGLYEVAGNTVYTLTIQEDDEIGDFVQVRFAEAQLEVNEGSGSADLVVRAIPPPGIAISGSLEVEYRIVFSDTTALPADYTLASSGTLTLSDGNRLVTLPVGLIDDSAQDSLPSRELVVELVQPDPIQTYVVVPPQRATLVINDDDGANAPVPRVYFERADSAPEEGNTVMVRVVAVPPPTGELTVAYQRMPGGTATAGSDYRTLSGSLTIPPQQGSALLSVELLNNPEDEAEETLLLRLSPPSPSAGYTLGSLRDHLLRIQDAQVPAVSFASAGRTVTEAPRSINRGRINVLVEIGLTVAPAPFQPLTVRYQVSGSAQQNQDYQGLPPNGAVDVLQIAASTTTHTLIVEVPPDELREGVETLVLELLDPLNPEDDSYRPGSEPVYTLTINDDPADGNLPQVLFGAADDLRSVAVDAPVLEVNEGEFVDIPVQVSAFSGAFDLSLAVDGTQSNAESGDYTLPATTAVDSAAGAQVRLQTNQDVDGDDEVLVLEFAPSAAYQTMPLLVRSSLVVYILDDEAPTTGPVVQFAETSSIVREEQSNSQHQVELTRSVDTSEPLTVSLQAVGRGDVTAGNGDADADDYNFPSNMVTFAAGQSRTRARLDLFGNLRSPRSGATPATYDFSEGEQVVELALVAGGGYRLGDRRRHQVRIIDRIRPAGNACFLADGSPCCHTVGNRGCAVGGNTEIREGDIIYFEHLLGQPGSESGITRGRTPILQMPIEVLYCVSTAGRPLERSSRVSHRRSDNPDFLILDAQPVNLGSDPYRGQCSGISGAQAYRVVGLPGQNRLRITMEIVDDNRVEGSDGNRLVAEFRPSPVTPVDRIQNAFPADLLCNSTGGTGEGANNPFCVVIDNDVAPVPLPAVGFSDTGGTVSEDGGMMRIPLDVSPASERGVVVDYALLPTSSALLNQDVIIDGVDGTLRGQVVLFGDGGEIQALLRDDTVRLGDITLILELRQRPGVYQIAADRNRYTLTIEDDD